MTTEHEHTHVSPWAARAMRHEAELAAVRAAYEGEVAWLVSRLEGNTGLSANALVVATIRGTEPTRRPLDASDLARCAMAVEAAPPHLAARAREIYADFVRGLRERA